ncbi:F-box protein At-B [Aristolochia californica]|uniref:F-box protein At-B n=1 Tax=Aristolochia californica TaxID=171875 RepID=UPI0035D96906
MEMISQRNSPMVKMLRTESDNYMEGLPRCLLQEIFQKLDVESLCRAASVSRTLNSPASQALASLSVLDFSGFSPDARILEHVLCDNNIVRNLTLDCRRLNDSSIRVFAKGHLHELVLLKCSHFTSWIFTAIGENCPRLRTLKLEMIHRTIQEPHRMYKERFAEILKGCLHLETLSVKVRDIDGYCINFGSLAHLLPETIRVLQLRSTYEEHMKQLIHHPISSRLVSLSLAVDVITDELIYQITHNLSLLVKLDLEDKPSYNPQSHSDLSNHGLQSLASCTHLTDLSIVRRRENVSATFRMVNDFGIFLLIEGCKNLESVKLGGFSRVTDAGFASILLSCKWLRKFEVINAFFLSDLAFHDLGNTICSLVDVRLPSCSLLTSEAAQSIALCKNLEMLDLGGCKSVADQGLESLSSLTRLTTLYLSGTDITDSGLRALGCGSSPIESLSLRNCKRVTDRGLAFLLVEGGIIAKTLSALDLGFMPGISDKTIFTIIEASVPITDLCIRNCFYVTDASIEALTSDNGAGKRKKPLRRLDLCNCSGLTSNCFKLLGRNCFTGLRWLGAGSTRLSKRDTVVTRASLIICFSGCEMGCGDDCTDLMET